MQNTYARGSIFVRIFRFRLSGDGHKTLQDGRSEALALDFRFLAAGTVQRREEITSRIDVLFDGPRKAVEGQDTEIRIVVSVASTRQEEVDEVRDMLAKKGCFQYEQCLVHIHQSTCASLVTRIHTLSNDVDDGGKQALELLLYRGYISERAVWKEDNSRWRTCHPRPHMWRSCQLPWLELSLMLKHKYFSTYLHVVIRTSKLSGSLRSVAKSWKKDRICASYESTISSRMVKSMKMPISRCATIDEVMAE